MIIFDGIIKIYTVKKIFIPFLALFLISSCEDTADPVEETPAPVDLTAILPTKVTEKKSDGQTFTTVYTYDGKKLKKEEKPVTNESVVYTYNGDLISKAEEYSGTTITLRREFTYENGKMTAEKITNYKIATPAVSTTVYEYPSDNNVKFTRLGGLYDVYVSNNGNVAVASRTQGAVLRKFTNSFDGQNNPYKNIKGYLKINSFLFMEGNFGNNNLTNSASSQTGVISGTYTSAVVNTYNSNNFLTKAVRTEITMLSSTTPPNTPVTSTSTYTYEYNQ